MQDKPSHSQTGSIPHQTFPPRLYFTFTFFLSLLYSLSYCQVPHHSSNSFTPKVRLLFGPSQLPFQFFWGKKGFIYCPVHSQPNFGPGCPKPCPCSQGHSGVPEAAKVIPMLAVITHSVIITQCFGTDSPGSGR